MWNSEFFRRMRVSKRTLLGLCAVFGMLWMVAGTAQAQSPVEELVTKAETALTNTLSACSNKKFLECITLDNAGGHLNGTMTRTINGGTEASEIDVRAALSGDEAKRIFQIEAESYRKQDSTVQFWASETFAGAAGQTDSAVLTVWLPPNNDKPQADGRGTMVCGNLNVNFEIFLTAPLGVVSTNGQALVNETRAQLKELMEQVGTALSQEGACASEAPLLTLDPIASAAPYSLFEGETTKISGVVWAMDKDGLNHGPVKAKVVLGGVGKNVELTETTDEQGYFEVDYPMLDAISGDVLITAVPLDPKRYKQGSRRVSVEVKLHGALQITVATNKPIFKRGETVTVSGNVLADGKPFAAFVALASDALPLPQLNANADGSFTYDFVPGTEPNRARVGQFVTGVHYVVVKAIYPGYTTGFSSANYVVQSEIANADNCEPVEIQILQVTGVANVLPLDEQELARQGVLSGLAIMNNKTTLAEGMSVVTSGGARVALNFDFGSGSTVTVVLNPLSTLKVGRFCKDASGQLHARLEVNQIGQVGVNVLNSSDQQGPLDFKIVTPAVAVQSVHTRYFVNVAENGETTVAALEGNVIVSEPQGGNEIEIAAGTLVAVQAGGGPAQAVVNDIEGTVDAGMETLLKGGNVVSATSVPAVANPAPTAIAAGTNNSSSPNPTTVGNAPGTTNAASSSNVGVSGFVVAGLAIAGVVLLGALGFVLLRRKPNTAPPPPPQTPMATANDTPPPSPIADGRPMYIPEQRTTPKSTRANLSYQQAEDEYFKYRGQLATGRITQQDFEERLRELMVQDAQGQYWMLGAETGKWNVHDGKTWIEAEPKR